MNDHDVIVDFGGLDDEEIVRVVKAVIHGKKINTKLTCLGDGDFNSLYTPEVSIAFNLNTLIDIATSYGFTMNHSRLSKEDEEEIIDELNREGRDESFRAYKEEGEFLD